MALFAAAIQCFRPHIPGRRAKCFQTLHVSPLLGVWEQMISGGYFAVSGCVICQRPVGAAYNIRIGCGKIDLFMSWWSG